MVGGEFDWIERIVGRLGSIGSGIGDDAAVLSGPDGETWVWTIDTLIEHVHFRFDWLDPEAVGHRGLIASLSDLAAMGAEPVAALTALAAPPDWVADRVERLYAGLGAAAQRAACPIVGGDLSRADQVQLTVSALGRCAGRALTRGDARPGAEVWVTGALGGPAAALAWLAREGPEPQVMAHAAYERLAHPAARVDEVRWLKSRARLGAAIDISDGLSGDARHVAGASGVSITIDVERLPVDAGASDVGRQLNANPIEWALHGGEEFELLLTARAGSIAPLVDEFEATFGLALTAIGTASEGTGVQKIENEVTKALDPKSWNHFTASSDFGF
ncbi:MAG: thiamine-phosphate kinase [Gemmatimonadota bacterium]